MKRLLGFSLMAALVAFLVYGTPPAEPAKSPAAPPPPMPTPAERYVWQPVSIGDHLKGTVGIGIMAPATIVQGIRSQHQAQLLIGCRSNETIILLNTNHYVPAYDGAQVSYRIDQGPIRSAWWSGLLGSEGIGLFNGSGIPLLRDMARQNAVWLRMTVSRSSLEPLDVTVEVAGIAKALAPIAAKCGWQVK